MKELIKHGRRKIGLVLPLILLVSVIVGLLMFKPEITGFVTHVEEASYTDNIILTINENTTYDWLMQNPGQLKSIKISV